jgi:hypothetical protein
VRQAKRPRKRYEAAGVARIGSMQRKDSKATPET